MPTITNLLLVGMKNPFVELRFPSSLRPIDSHFIGFSSAIYLQTLLPFSNQTIYRAIIESFQSHFQAIF
jgi:hypothetical protein